MIEENAWMTLGEAADRLGVHANTLRRWADQGRIPFMLTLGGHRRFALAQIEDLLAQQHQEPNPQGVGALWIEATLVQMRSELVASEGEPWVTDFDTHDRHEKRILGRRMMELVLQFVSRDDCDAVILSEARAMGAGYAASAQTAGMSVTTALSAILFFRDALTQTIFDLPDTIHVSAHEQRRLLGRMSHLLDKVELAIVETYDSDRQHLN